MFRFFSVIAITACLGSSLCAADDNLNGNVPKAVHEIKGPNGPAPGGPGGPPKPKGPPPITYHNGPVMTGTTHVYYIWYGAWSTQDPAAFAILENLARSMGGSPYFNIQTTYYQIAGGAQTNLSNSVTLAGEYQDSAYSQGKNLNDRAIAAIVSNALNGHLPADANGVYFVLTTPDVNETSGFCTQYCGWHTYGYLGTTPIKYAFIGDSARCPNACSEVASGATPNGDLGADAMASIISHELDEATNDPQLNAWYDNQGEESADKCAWTFGATYKTSNGAIANMSLGGKNYLIQQNWVYNSNASLQACALSH